MVYLGAEELRGLGASLVCSMGTAGSTSAIFAGVLSIGFGTAACLGLKYHNYVLCNKQDWFVLVLLKYVFKSNLITQLFVNFFSSSWLILKIRFHIT